MTVHHGTTTSEEEAEEERSDMNQALNVATRASSSEEPKPSESKRFEIPEPEQEGNLEVMQNENVRRRVTYARELRKGDVSAEPEKEYV